MNSGGLPRAEERNGAAACRRPSDVQPAKWLEGPSPRPSSSPGRFAGVAVHGSKLRTQKQPLCKCFHSAFCTLGLQLHLELRAGLCLRRARIAGKDMASSLEALPDGLRGGEARCEVVGELKAPGQDVPAQAKLLGFVSGGGVGRRTWAAPSMEDMQTPFLWQGLPPFLFFRGPLPAEPLSSCMLPGLLSRSPDS